MGAKENDHLLDAVALLVLDVQERLLPVMADPEAFTDRVAFAIEAARIFNLRVVFTEQVPEKLGPTLPVLKNLAPNARVFRKSTFSALQANGLQDYLRDLNIYHLLVCGLETPVCIYQTALQAADLDLDTTLLSDCLASRRPEDDAYVLPSLIRSGCHVLPSESVFYSMVADATDSRFRAFSDLVKRHDAIRRGEAPPVPRPQSGPARTEPSPAVEAAAGHNAVQPDRTNEPSSPDSAGGLEQPRPKRSRGRRRQSAPRATGDPVPSAGSSETPSRPVESAPEAPPPGPGSTPSETGSEGAKKPRRRRRGPRKPKGISDSSSSGDAPGGNSNQSTSLI